MKIDSHGAASGAYPSPRTVPALLYAVTGFLAGVVPLGGLFVTVLAVFFGIGPSAPLGFRYFLLVGWDTRMMFLGPVLLLAAAGLLLAARRTPAHALALAGSLLIFPVSVRAFLAAFLRNLALVNPRNADRWLFLVVATLVVPSLASLLLSARLLSLGVRLWPQPSRKIHLRP